MTHLENKTSGIKVYNSRKRQPCEAKPRFEEVDRHKPSYDRRRPGESLRGSRSEIYSPRHSRYMY